MNKEFNTWWHSGESLTDNPYEDESAAFWAWEGWCAAVKSEREACAKVCEEPGWNAANWCAKKIRERNN